MSRRPNFLVLATTYALIASGWMNTDLLRADDTSEPGLLPAEELQPEETTTVEATDSDVEIIRERYANRAIKIEREVIRDAEDNYINHGSWRMWDQKGNMIAEGTYRNGNREGNWTGWFLRSDSKLLSAVPFKDFTAPFISQVSFKNGEIHGKWIISDSKQRKISEWEYQDGVRHGIFTYMHATGRKMREVQYREGVIDGKYSEWNNAGKQIKDDTYEDGRRIGRKVEFYPNKQKKTDGMYLYARQVSNGSDDWWTLRLAPFISEGQDQKHGEWRSWYSNGQQRVHGEYEYGVPKTEFVWSWWFSNGQKAVEGTYENGHKNGKWIWWHANGQKKIEGKFVLGAPSGRWLWWAEDGRVSQKVEYAPGSGAIATDPKPAEPDEVSEVEAAEANPKEAAAPDALKFRR